MDNSNKNPSILQFFKRKISNSPPRDNSQSSNVTKTASPRKIHVTEQPNEEQISHDDTHVSYFLFYFSN